MRNEFCKNHPDRKAMDKRNVCLECYHDYQKDYRMRNSKVLKEKKSIYRKHAKPIFLSYESKNAILRRLYDPDNIITKEVMKTTIIYSRRG